MKISNILNIKKTSLSKEELILFEKLHKGKIEDDKVFSKPEYEGYWKSIIDKYPESAHFVYELLQNADDAEATYAEILLFDDYLVFKHNGKISGCIYEA